MPASLQIDLDHLPAKLVLNTTLSDRAFWTLCRTNDLIHFERTREGEIRMNPPAGGFTGNSNAEILGQLRDWWLEHQRGLIFDSSTGFRLPDGSTLSPDASYVSAKRLKGLSLRGFPRLCPDFVVELLSETDRLKDLQIKMERWVENGALLAWLIDPYRRKVTIHRPAQVPETFTGSRLIAEAPVRGFTLNLAKVWGRYPRKR